MSPASPLNVHGTGLVLGGVGVLVQGPSGAGKSLLALELLERAALAQVPAALVGDDRIDLAIDQGALVMTAPAALAGLVELRGRGIVRRPFVARARLHLVVDLVDDLVRMLEEEAFETDVLGVTVRRCPVPQRGVIDAGHQLLLVNEAVAELRPQGAP